MDKNARYHPWSPYGRLMRPPPRERRPSGMNAVSPANPPTSAVSYPAVAARIK